jgi:hypothetical protein
VVAHGGTATAVRHVDPTLKRVADVGRSRDTVRMPQFPVRVFASLRLLDVLRLFERRFDVGARQRSGLELIDCHTHITEDASQSALGDVAVAVHRDSGAATVRVAHDVVTAADSRNLETVALQSTNDPCAGDGGKRRH